MTTHRDPEIIRKDIELSDIKAANCALQGGELLTRMQLLQKGVEDCRRGQQHHDAQKAAFEEELKAAVAARSGSTSSKPLVPLELIVNGRAVDPPPLTSADARPSSTEPPT